MDQRACSSLARSGLLGGLVNSTPSVGLDPIRIDDDGWMLPRLAKALRYLDEHWPVLWFEAQSWGQSLSQDWRTRPYSEVLEVLRRVGRCPADWTGDVKEALANQNLAALARHTGITTRHLQRLRKGTRSRGGKTRAASPNFLTYLKVMCAVGRNLPLLRLSGEARESGTLRNRKTSFPDAARPWKTSKKVKSRGRLRHPFLRNYRTLRSGSQKLSKALPEPESADEVAPQPDRVALKVAPPTDRVALEVAPPTDRVAPQVAPPTEGVTLQAEPMAIASAPPQAAPPPEERRKEGARSRRTRERSKKARSHVRRRRAQMATHSKRGTKTRAKKTEDRGRHSLLTSDFFRYLQGAPKKGDGGGGEMSKEAKSILDRVEGGDTPDPFDRLIEKLGEVAKQNEAMFQRQHEAQAVMFQKFVDENRTTTQYHMQLVNQLTEAVDGRFDKLTADLKASQADQPQALSKQDQVFNMLMVAAGELLKTWTAPETES